MPGASAPAYLGFGLVFQWTGQLYPNTGRRGCGFKLAQRKIPGPLAKAGKESVPKNPESEAAVTQVEAVGSLAVSTELGDGVALASPDQLCREPFLGSLSPWQPCSYQCWRGPRGPAVA